MKLTGDQSQVGVCRCQMDDTLLNRAFDVEEITEEFDPNIPPATGHEYLQHVMYEAKNCPQVVVAEIGGNKIKNLINIDLGLQNNTSEQHLAPSADWQHYQVAMFSDLRQKVEKFKRSGKFKPIPLPKLWNEEKWYNICCGDANSRLEPSLTLLLSLSEPMLERILEYQLEWLDDGLKPEQGKWLYALLACLSLPITPLTCSVLRNLARQCAKIRGSETSLDECSITTLNLIICLVRKYFGQIDLMD